MKINKKWFSIVMVMWLVVFINLIAIGILEYIVPYSRETKNIENSVASYYQAESWIEDALFFLKDKDFEPWTQSWNSLSSDVIDSAFNIVWRGSVLPPTWQWNSEYDNNWNKISVWNPIQFEIWDNYIDSTDNFNNIMAFRVPDIDESWTMTLSWTNILPVINWQLSSEWNSLNATGSYIYPSDICNSGESFSDCELDFLSFWWIDLNNNERDFSDFYDNECWAWSWCILKLSVINKLEEDTNNTSIPYLEWQFKFDDNIPLRYTIIDTQGKAYGYKKDLKVRVSQETTNEAFDFTVFQ